MMTLKRCTRALVCAALLFSVQTQAAENADPVKTMEDEVLEVGFFDLSSDETFVQVRRTASTPNKVKFRYQFTELYTYCESGHYEESCETCCETNESGFNYCWEECSEVYVCDSYGTGESTESKDLKLDFDDAFELKEGEEEIFEIGLRQKNAYSSKIHTTAKPVSTLGDYKIKRAKFLIFKKHGFVFKAQD